MFKRNGIERSDPYISRLPIGTPLVVSRVLELYNQNIPAMKDGIAMLLTCVRKRKVDELCARDWNVIQYVLDYTLKDMYIRVLIPEDVYDNERRHNTTLAIFAFLGIINNLK